MREQKLVLKNIGSFNTTHIFECGQCFRWNKNENGSYTGIIKNGVLNVSTNNENIIFEGLLNGDIQAVVYDYFDLRYRL